MTNFAGENCRITEYPDLAALSHHLDLRLEKALGQHSWLGRTQSGTPVVLKSGPGASAQLYDFLVKFKALYPSFAYPHLVSAQPGSYLVYDFIPGDSLSEREFDSEQTLAAAFDLSGRITALFRSLGLAPMFQGLQEQASRRPESPTSAARRLASLGSGLACQVDGLALRRWEASRSYAWAQEIIPHCSLNWPGEDSCLAARWSALRDRVELVTSIHLAAPGSNLAHTCFTPEHLLITPGDGWGVIGWQVAPRPYNYMRYRYLAWSLIHTAQGDIESRYRYFLAGMPAIQFSAANSLTFVLSLLETWVETSRTIPLRAEKIKALCSFIDEALALPVADSPACPD
jgi:hypothetical protein